MTSESVAQMMDRYQLTDFEAHLVSWFREGWPEDWVDFTFSSYEDSDLVKRFAGRLVAIAERSAAIGHMNRETGT